VSPNEPIFLTFDEVVLLHHQSLVEHGGSEGVRDRGQVESALASAVNTFAYGEGDIFEVAASYAYHIAEAQAFIDGNKRTALTAALTFLAMNGGYRPISQDNLVDAMIDIANKKLDKPGLARLFRNQIHPPR
jgi:death-on-curing protein